MSAVWQLASRSWVSAASLWGAMSDWACPAWTSGWSGWVHGRLGRTFYTLSMLLIVVLLRWALGKAADRRISDGASYRKVLRLLNYGAVTVVLVSLWRIWIGKFGSIGTFLGLVSAGIAIAMQDTIANLAGAMYVFWTRAFHVGDRISIGETTGDVIDTGLFQFTMVEVGKWVDADQSTGRMVTVPNSKVLKTPLYNYTRGFAFIWHEMPILVTFESNWRAAKEIALRAGQEASHGLSKEAASQMKRMTRRFNIKYGKLTPVVYTKVVDSGILLTLRFLTRPRQRRGMEEKVWEYVLDAFAHRVDIDFAYPTTRYYDNRREGKPETGGPQAPGFDESGFMDSRSGATDSDASPADGVRLDGPDSDSGAEASGTIDSGRDASSSS
ncbi:MAG: mechanosensitive ion channel family protein [Deltaproteobacteria bacterium]|nr:mechanosensitive ion channel family protein [Deltaproteobacteria bacterium]